MLGKWIVPENIAVCTPSKIAKPDTMPTEFSDWLETQPHSLRENATRLNDKLDELILAGREIDGWFNPFSVDSNQGVVLISDLFSCLEGQQLFKNNIYRGSFYVLGNDLKRHMLSVVRQSVRAGETFRSVEDDLNSMSAMFITMLHNCNPMMSLGRRGNTTRLRAEYLDHSRTDLLPQLYSLRVKIKQNGKVDKAALDRAKDEVEALHDKYTKRRERARGHDDFDSAVERMQKLEEVDNVNRRNYKELTLCMRALKKTPRNRESKLAV